MSSGDAEKKPTMSWHRGDEWAIDILPGKRSAASRRGGTDVFASPKWRRGYPRHRKPSIVGHPTVLGLVACLLLMSPLYFKGSLNSLTDGSRHSEGQRAGPRQASHEHPTPPMSHLLNLIVVAGHSVFTGSNYLDAWNASNWYLEPYQQGIPGQVDSFVQHIEMGVAAAVGDPHALLMFSGGETRESAGSISEAASYWSVASAQRWFGMPEVKHRTVLEESARDSFENVLFSLCRFNQVTGRYPWNVTLVSYEFKRSRFFDMHREAIRFPESRFFFLGTPTLSPQAAIQGEARTLASFRGDPYSCTGKLLDKKETRNPFACPVPYLTPGACPEMAPLLRYCGPSIYKGRVPWGI